MFTLFDFAVKRAELTPGKVALVEWKSGRETTYRELNENAERFAGSLARSGIGRGERIAILCHNTPRFFEILFGCAKAGVVLVPLNWRQTPPELVPLLDDCQPRLLLHDSATAELARALAEARSLPRVPILDETESPTGGSYQGLLETSPGEMAWDPVWPADGLWYMLYTSGTTGRPKAVMQTFGMALANYVNLSQAIDLTAADVTPNFLPLFHTAGINLHTLPTLIAGGTVVVLPGFDPDSFLELIGSGRITALLAVPAVYQALSLHPRFAEMDLTRVRSWSSGGAPLPEELIRLFAERGAALCQGYGMTETGPTVFLMDPESVTRKPGSVGKPQLLSRVRLVDAEGRDVPAGEAGEIWVKGPNVTPGYWNHPEATAEALDGSGWLRTGDVGRCDEEGYYYIVDRIKDMYISGGENVYPAEVERVLIEHPSVLEAAVIGVPDPQWGEVGHACLLAQPGRTVDVEALREFCRARLAGYKIPKSFEVVSEFPRTPAGKVQKHILRSRFGKGGQP
ncbi:MAG: long-chain fatty acid--CoA ligase [Gammaproteobacteria bacterium]